MLEWSVPSPKNWLVHSVAAAHVPIVVGLTPIVEVAGLMLLDLPAQPTAEQLHRETLHPASLPEWSAARGGAGSATSAIGPMSMTTDVCATR